MSDYRCAEGTLQDRHVSVGAAAAELSVSEGTIRNYCEAGELAFCLTAGGHRRISVRSIRRWQGLDDEPQQDRLTICYARCSTNAQTKAGNLDRQAERLVKYCETEFGGKENLEIEIIKDTGSGLSEKRRGYLRMIDLILSGKVRRVVVSFKDRLARYGVRTFEVICEKHGVELIVTNDKEEVSDEEEMTSDIMSLITVYASRKHGKRGGETTRMVITEDAKKRILELHQNGLPQTEIVTHIRNENFTCPKTNRKYAIHAVRKTILEQEKINRLTKPYTSPIERFISEKCVKGEGNRCFSRPFHREYASWAKSNNLPVPTSHSLTTTVKRLLDIETGRTSSGFGFFNGIALKDNERASRSHLG